MDRPNSCSCLVIKYSCYASERCCCKRHFVSNVFHHYEPFDNEKKIFDFDIEVRVFKLDVVRFKLQH